MVVVRMSKEEVEVLDALRGSLTRSAWLRKQVQVPATRAPRTFAAPPVKATPAPTDAQTAPAPPIRTTPSTIETIPEGRHLFRRGEVIGERHVNGQTIRTYLCTCGCGEAREDARA
jgi:hypothetical protein